ncbi:hypothetical protein TVAG_494180 [Trichomonas vaginalis G3]|uniref:Uncharacterized protein n=1 Tax=Trichomonas vaginalis (strain ATCC PRA-98 / G3) TaxID=412133 RepID=A2DQ49_TRIV3|nr:hypothetical protein TVAGG3_0385240 [Trichomonas vaginalis G3]EAY17476.1 hypothetical protein TVAG_494180 [Trichomonas vaginalis G3]KAI5533581.1 hypothetical protein TVAGG3_0385240 [Trichomonas vaginalis G3]|eukprot:XP_001329611.1 hypothetical protein [Trichomonas vaginalis G3]
MFFKYVSIVNAKAITCFACYTKFAYFENIYFKNITNNRNAYFVSTQYIEVKNIFSDNLFAILGNYSAQAISTNYTEIVPFSGYYEEAVLNYLKEETYIDTNKYQSEPIIVQDIKGEFKLDKVIFCNITSSNNGGSISICCFSSNICITNCEFDQCVTNTYTKKTCGGAIYIIGHKTFTSITNVIGENCFAGRGHFCDIYSNYPTSITKATIIKCTPYSHFSESTTNYIYYDNIFNSCNISNNCMGENMHFSDFSSKFTDCVIASNTLIQGISYIKSSSLSLTSCIVYKNSYDDDNESTVSTFEYDNLELHDCYLLIEQSFNFSDSNVTNCSINNETIDFVHNLAISKQIGCDTKLIHITISKFTTWKIIVIVLSVLVFIAIITISIAIYHQCKLKRLEKRNNLSTLLDGDFG